MRQQWLLALLVALAQCLAFSEPLARTPAAQRSLVVLSTLDGAVHGFDAATGHTVFALRPERAAVESWAAEGMPEYVPTLDGALYRIDPVSEEASVVDGKFVVAKGLLGDGVVEGPVGADGVVLTKVDTSVLYIDLRTGAVVRSVGFADREGVGGALGEDIVVLSRTSVGVRVVDAASGEEIANASLTHTTPTFLDRGLCLLPVPGAEFEGDADGFSAELKGERKVLVVRSRSTGSVLWSKNLPSLAVEAHGMGSVVISGAETGSAALGDGGASRDGGDADTAAPLAALDEFEDALPGPKPASRLVVSRHAGYSYGMLAAPSDETDESADDVATNRSDMRRHKKNVAVYDIAVGARGSRAERILGLGNLPRLSEDPTESVASGALPTLSYVITQSEVLVALLLLIGVGLVGYAAGRRPRRSSASSAAAQKRKRKRKKKSRANGAGGLDAAARETGEGVEADDDDEDDDDDEEEEGEEEAEANGENARALGRVDGGSKEARPLLGILDSPTNAALEVSTGSSGSLSGGGYVSNRTVSGWMTVGCLHVSSKVLGTGSHGTIVYEGKMLPGERRVAVKRLLRQFFESARKEISLLVELDEASPHVVRYFAMEEDSEFIYLALELCAASLAERVCERESPVPPESYIGGPPPNVTRRSLRQLLQGLADLHRVGVVHRDVKPHNVLISRSANGSSDIKLADVGLALRLAENRSSYTAVTNAGGGVGTTGWRAPEVLSGGRQTKAVDVFAAGCVVCYVLTGGQHPFGNAIFGRDGNIAANKATLHALEKLQLPEAVDIVSQMIDPIASRRPTAEEALNHPFFWTDATKLSFLVDISDRLYDLRHDSGRFTERLDRTLTAATHCSDWLVQMDMELLRNLDRGYDNSASGLLRVIRNKRNHYSELSASLRTLLGPLPGEDSSGSTQMGSNVDGESDGVDLHERNFLTYFTTRAPHLLMCVYRYAVANPALIAQPHFSRYGLEITHAPEQLPLHPMVRRARENRSGLAVAASSSARRERGWGRRMYTDDTEEFDEYEDMVEDAPVVPARNDRRTYFRHQLVSLQARCKEMPTEVANRAKASNVYKPSAYDRWRKRLVTGVFDDTTFSDDDGDDGGDDGEDGGDDYSDLPSGQRPPSPPPLSGSTAARAPPGFSRPPVVGPRRNTRMDDQGVAAARAPPGFSGPPGFPSTAPSASGRSNNRHSTPAGQVAPTVSQFSGEERVVDFSLLRRRPT